jgi:hypothetical protein
MILKNFLHISNSELQFNHILRLFTITLVVFNMLKLHKNSHGLLNVSSLRMKTTTKL